MSCGPPCPPCSPPSPPPCPQYCYPPPPTPCRPKPIMRGLFATKVTKLLTEGIVLGILSGLGFYFFVARKRIECYRDFYAKAELEDWADEMARKGLFQSVPPESIGDFK